MSSKNSDTVFLFACLQLCVNGTALPCPESTHVKCNETVSGTGSQFKHEMQSILFC